MNAFHLTPAQRALFAPARPRFPSAAPLGPELAKLAVSVTAFPRHARGMSPPSDSGGGPLEPDNCTAAHTLTANEVY